MRLRGGTTANDAPTSLNRRSGGARSRNTSGESSSVRGLPRSLSGGDFGTLAGEGHDDARPSRKTGSLQVLLRKDHDASDEGPIACGSASGQPTNALPMVYDLSSDPHEDSNLWWTDLTNAWMLVPFFKRIIENERSVKPYPNIKVGEDFTG